MPSKESSVKRSDTFPKYAGASWEEDEAMTSANNGNYDSNPELEEEQRSHSSNDLRSGEDSPPVSRSKKILNRFRSFRSRSRDKKKTREVKKESLDSEQELPLTPSDCYTSGNFDALFDEAEKRASGDELNRQIPVENKRHTYHEGYGGSVNGSGGAVAYNGRSDDGKAMKSEEEGACLSKENGSKENGVRRSRSLSRGESDNKRKRSNSKKRKKSPKRNGKGVDMEAARLEAAADRPYQDHPFYHMKVELIEAEELKAMDPGGTSDPYVKFRIDGKVMYKSRTIMKTLNPEWNEKFILPIEDLAEPIKMIVYDYDKGIGDDVIGVREIDPMSFEINKTKDMSVELLTEKKNKKKQLGTVFLRCTLIPKTQEDLEKYVKWTTKDMNKGVKYQPWKGIVAVNIVSGHNLEAMDSSGFSDPYVKVKLAEEKHKTKTKQSTLNPRFWETCELRWFEDQSSILEISVWDNDICGKDRSMGKASIDVSDLAPEITHHFDQKLEGGSGYIKLLVSVTALCCIDPVSDLNNFKEEPDKRKEIEEQYSLKNTPKNMKDVGWLQVKVIKAEGLASADLNGKSDPFCVLNLVNDRVQTHTIYKTLNPEWNKIFHMAIKDIHANLEVTVYDEDRDKKMEFLGKVVIPLFRIRKGVQRWYTLKDKTALARKKGAILLEMDYEYNPARAALRTINPKEKKYSMKETKFKLGEMKRNLDRLSKLGEAAAEGGKHIKPIMDWDNPAISAAAVLGFVIGVWTFELYMAPLGLFLAFFGQFLVKLIISKFSKDENDGYVNEEDIIDDDDDAPASSSKSKDKSKDPDEKKSFREKLQEIQDICLQIQEGLDMAATMGERVKNVFNFTVPYLSILAMIGCGGGVIVTYFVPLRVLVLLFGVNKMTKTLRKGKNFKDNNELLDFISRVPSDKELIMYRELKPDDSIMIKKKKREPQPETE